MKKSVCDADASIVPVPEKKFTPEKNGDIDCPTCGRSRRSRDLDDAAAGGSRDAAGRRWTGLGGVSHVIRLGLWSLKLITQSDHSLKPSRADFGHRENLPQSTMSWNEDSDAAVAHFFRIG